MKLAASDGEGSAADTVAITVEPFSARVTKTFSPSEDAYLRYAVRHGATIVSVELEYEDPEVTP